MAIALGQLTQMGFQAAAPIANWIVQNLDLFVVPGSAAEKQIVAAATPILEAQKKLLAPSAGTFPTQLHEVRALAVAIAGRALRVDRHRTVRPGEPLDDAGKRSRALDDRRNPAAGLEQRNGR